MSVKEFDSLASFAIHLATVHLAVAHAEHAALEKCARIIEDDAKAQIGEYQSAAGPFPEWADLADSTQADRLNKGYDPDEPLLRKGDLRDSIGREVGDREAVIGSKSDIAVYQEFGTPNIPPRPFIGPAAFKNQDKIQQIMGEALIEGLAGGQVAHAALGYGMSVKP